MKEKTRFLLENKKGLIDKLMDIRLEPSLSSNKKYEAAFEDIVDTFFFNSIKKEISEEPEIVKNDVRLKVKTFKEHEALQDIMFLNKEIISAWECRTYYDVVLNTYRVLTNFLPGWIKFSVNKNDNIASGVSGCGIYTQKLSIISKIKIPLGEQSIMRDIMLTGKMFKGALSPTLLNNFLLNRLMPGIICPEVIAIPLFGENGIKEIALSSPISENFSEIKFLCLKIFVFQTQKIIHEISYEQTIRNI